MKKSSLFLTSFVIFQLLIATSVFSQLPPDHLDYTELSKRINSNNSDVPLAKLHLGFYYLLQAKNPDSTLEILSELKKQLPLWDNSHQAVYYHLKAKYFLDQAKLDSAKSNYDKSLKLVKDIHYPLLKAKNYNGKAVAEVYGSHYEKGMEQMLKCLEILEDINDIQGLAMNEYNLGMLYVFTKNYRKAKYYHYKSISSVKKMEGNQQGLLSIRYGALCNIYVNENNTDSAQYCLNRMINNGDEQFNNYYYLKGCIALAKKESTLALPYLDTSLSKLSHRKKEKEVIYRLNKKAEAYLNLNQPKTSITQLQKADSLLDNKAFPFLRRKQDSLYYRAYEMLGNTAEALNYLKNYQMAVNKSLSLGDLQAASEKENKYHLGKKISEIEQQQKIINEKDTKIANFINHNKLLSFTIFTLLIIGGGLFFFNYRNKLKLKQQNALIKEEYQKLISKNLELEDRLKAISKKIQENEQIKNPEKYKSSALTDVQRKELMDHILDFMVKNKPFLNPKLNQNQLSEMINIPRHHFSEIINLNFGKNFYGFINLFRVEEAKKIIRNDTSNLTMLAVAYDAGFNSKASFNRVFKEMTGLTPSEYKRTHFTNQTGQ